MSDIVMTDEYEDPRIKEARKKAEPKEKKKDIKTKS